MLFLFVATLLKDIIYFFISERRVSKKYLFAFCGILLFFLTTDSFLLLIESIVSKFDDGNYILYAQSGSTNSLRATLLTSISLIYTLLNMEDLEGKYLVYSKLYLFSSALAVIAIRLSPITRIQMYFDIFSIVALPLMFKHNLEKGKVEIDRNNIGKTLLEILKRYVLPTLIVIIYLLRYYSFFTNPTWTSFGTYQTIFSAPGF